MYNEHSPLADLQLLVPRESGGGARALCWRRCIFFLLLLARFRRGQERLCDGGEWEVAEGGEEILVRTRAVLSRTLCFEAELLGAVRRFVVTADEKDKVGEGAFEGEDAGEGLAAPGAPVDKVACENEFVVRAGEACDGEGGEEAEDVAVDVADDVEGGFWWDRGEENVSLVGEKALGGGGEV